MLGRHVFHETMGKTPPHKAVVKFGRIVKRSHPLNFHVEHVDNCGVNVCEMLKILLNCKI